MQACMQVLCFLVLHVQTSRGGASHGCILVGKLYEARTRSALDVLGRLAC